MSDSSPAIRKAIHRAKSRGRVRRLLKGSAAAGVIAAVGWTSSRCWDGRYPTQTLEISEALHVLELPYGTTLPELRASALNRVRSETKRLIEVLHRVQVTGNADEAEEASEYLLELARYATGDN